MKKAEKSLQEEIIKVCLRIAKRREGALIIVGENVKYTPLVQQYVKSFNIIENTKTLESLALMDGAIILNKKGFMTAYGVKVKADKILKNFGTKHSAAFSASLIKDTTCFLVSEEESKVKIFKNGKIIMQIDGLQKGIENEAKDISNLLESIGFGTIGTLGAGLALPAIGVSVAVAFIPGVLIFGSTYYLLKKLKELNDKKVKK